MLAMCVRKPDDASTPTSFSQSGGSRRRLKSLKDGSKSKTCKEPEKREPEEKTEPEIVRDDEDGHLIYSKGDLLQSRCMPSNVNSFNYSLCVIWETSV